MKKNEGATALVTKPADSNVKPAENAKPAPAANKGKSGKTKGKSGKTKSANKSGKTSSKPVDVSNEHAQATIVRLALAAGNKGVSLQEVAEARGSTKVGPFSRTVKPLVRDGIVKEKNGRYVPTAKAKSFEAPKAGSSRKTERKPSQRKPKASNNSAPGASIDLQLAISLIGEDRAAEILSAHIRERLQD